MALHLNNKPAIAVNSHRHIILYIRIIYGSTVGNKDIIILQSRCCNN